MTPSAYDFFDSTYQYPSSQLAASYKNECTFGQSLLTFGGLKDGEPAVEVVIGVAAMLDL